jgi:hypothetical protein
MYEPTEREVSIETCRTLNKIEEKLNWIIGVGVAILIAILWRS